MLLNKILDARATPIRWLPLDVKGQPDRSSSLTGYR
jgi:hypothetical protein